MTLTDPSCRILTLSSSSKDLTSQFLQRLIKNDLPLATTDNPSIIPWTIANKYYTAHVHFQVYQLSEWTSSDEQLETVPAVLYTWTAGQPYRQHVQMISQSLSHHNFHVSLAIRLPSTTTTVEGTDDDETDAFLGSLGFEFIDAQHLATPSDCHRGGLPRAIDALSTIMWPSMIQIPSKHRGHELLRSTHDDTREELSSLITAHPPAGRDSMQQELEELERWLDDDSSDDHSDSSESVINNDPWSAAARTSSSSPTEDPSTPGPNKNAFDDDFTAFLSASSSVEDPEISKYTQTSSGRQSPLVASSSFSSMFTFGSGSDISGRSTPVIDGSETSRLSLNASDFGVSYRSLGSVSDFGDPEAEELYNKEDFHDEMPSNAEIAATSERIFGAPLNFSPTDGYETHSATEKKHPLPFEVEVATPSEADLERLDLQSMLSALQGLKEEISGMPDSRERKRAAARVALGLVYGLEDNSN